MNSDQTNLPADFEAPLAEAVESARYGGTPVLLTLSRPLDAAGAPIDLLRDPGDAYYWARPGLEMAAIRPVATIEALDGYVTLGDPDGRAIARDPTKDSFAGVERLRSRLFANGVHAGWQRPLLVGGFRFDASAPADADWAPFPAARFVLPGELLIRKRGVLFGVVARWVRPEDSEQALTRGIALALDRLVAHRTPATVGAPHVGAREWLPQPAVWGAAVTEATRRIDRGQLQKIVLARRLRLLGESAFEPVGVVRALRRRFPGCYTYLARHGDTSFVGASPELLVSDFGGTVRSFPLAGTVRRGAVQAEAARRLFADPKERWEHRLVVEAVRDALGPVTRGLVIPAEPSPVRAGAMLHLGTRIRGRLVGHESALELAGRLHPTPAVGTAPRSAPRGMIRELEGFDRGWYAGPIGWVDSEGEGELALALRCALLADREATLFVGAGIVAGSTAEGELAETELKTRSMLSALTASRG